MSIALALLTLLALGATWIAHLSVLAVVRKRPAPKGEPPPVTLLKPLKGLEDGLWENLCSFARQDHPGLQILFGAADPADPALELARRVRDAHPHVDIEIVAGARPFGLNPKVTNLASMVRHAKHELWMISDSNVRARPDYVASAVAEVTRPGVGMVTHMFAGTGGRSLGARFENLHLNSWVAGGMGLSQVFTRTACVVGKSMVFRRADLERAGGFAGVRDVLAEDYVLGLRFAKLGLDVVTAPQVVESVNDSWSLARFVSRHQRWGLLRRRLSPVSFALEPLLNPALFSSLLAVAGHPLVALAAITGKIASDALLARRLLGRWPRVTDLALVPVKDLLVAVIWVLSGLRRTVEWRGQRLVVGRGTVLRLSPRPADEGRTDAALHLRP